jgi:hypothetical protein
MNGLVAFLLRYGGGLLRDGAEILIGQALIRTVTQRLKGFLLFYAVVAIFALAALVFLYVLIYRWLSLRLGDVSAAAILCGANLLLVAFMLAGRALFRPRRVAAASPLAEVIRAQAGHLGIDPQNGHFEAGLAAGAELGRHLRKATPQIALAAAVLGLVIGLRPQLLSLLTGLDRPAKARRRAKTERPKDG